MARTSGSDDLFRLIHSLTTEEKGYFKKFARRHSSGKNEYLKLFDTINKQPKFEEISLQKKFPGYRYSKVYLKDMILDSLVLYHRNTHDHIDLLAQTQKIQILLLKGFRTEALKMLEKALKKASQMELFTIERYLLRFKRSLEAEKFNVNADIHEWRIYFEKKLNTNLEQEKSLSDWEILADQWFETVFVTDRSKKPDLSLDFKSISQKRTTSTRSEIRKFDMLFYSLYLELKQIEKYELTKKQVALVKKFRQKQDNSYNSIGIQNNHIMSTTEVNRYLEAIKLSDEMVAGEKYKSFTWQNAFIKSTLVKLPCYFHLAEFEKHQELIQKVDREMNEHLTLTKNKELIKRYYGNKVLSLFANKKFTDCWRLLQDKSMNVADPKSMIRYTDCAMLQLMTQVELGNYDITNQLANKLEKKLLKNKLADFTYNSLLTFFKLVTNSNKKQAALQTLNLVETFYKNNNAPYRKALGQLKYTYWLTEVATGKSLRNSLHEWLKAVPPYNPAKKA